MCLLPIPEFSVAKFLTIFLNWPWIIMAGCDPIRTAHSVMNLQDTKQKLTPFIAYKQCSELSNSALNYLGFSFCSMSADDIVRNLTDSKKTVTGNLWPRALLH